MTLATIQSLIQRTPFLGFARLSAVDRAGGTHATQLPFEGLLKNHVGTLHAGALFTLAYSSALAALPEAHQMSLRNFDSSIQFKRPSKGPVWASSEVLECGESGAVVKSTIFSESQEPLVEFNIRFESRGAA